MLVPEVLVSEEDLEQCRRFNVALLQVLKKAATSLKLRKRLFAMTRQLEEIGGHSDV